MLLAEKVVRMRTKRLNEEIADLGAVWLLRGVGLMKVLAPSKPLSHQVVIIPHTYRRPLVHAGY